MNKDVLYSIGHGNRKIEDFIQLLKEHNISYVLDVRSQPYSKFNPQFNQNDLKHYLESNGIKYVFMGDSLGGRPKDESCYDKEGKVDYEVLKNKDFYKEGIKRLRTAYEKGIPVALMCSESKPIECHRSKLIGMSLIDEGDEKIFIQHIDENGRIKDQAMVMNELNGGKNAKDLFNEQSFTTSRKSYLQ